MKCNICKCDIEQYGNNPYPLCAKDDFESRCCDECNMMVIKARLALAKHTSIDLEEGDTVAIFYSKNSNAPIEMIGDQGKFLAGIVESIIQTDKNKKIYKGSWGNFALDSETDSFVKI